MTITSYPKYSTYEHTTSGNLRTRWQNFFDATFPENLSTGPRISSFFVMSSAGKSTLLLGNTFSFTDLRNSCDPLSEICPVIFDSSSRTCSEELQKTVRECGEAIARLILAIDEYLQFDKLYFY